MISRRRFAFWVGFGLFTLSDKLRVYALDDLAAAGMRRGGPAPPGPDGAQPFHWRLAENDGWRWIERETLIDGKWTLSGITTPVNKQTGEAVSDASGYLDASLAPAEVRFGLDGEEAEAVAAAAEKYADRHASDKRRSRHGRPPSKWLRSLEAAELSIWLKSITVPEAGVSGMSYWEHLTRDHSFDPAKIEGLSIEEQAKLHAAAHFGY
ncbi:MAG TPA: hypothetical protein VEQ85_02545 [Lacipirellulaceae bacterium]|nr:hypothetical protein [Lacipirellulaceae bacterium]